jgi:hypothetical protein
MRKHPAFFVSLVGITCLGLGSVLTLAVRALAADRDAVAETTAATATAAGAECKSQYSPEALAAVRALAELVGQTSISKGLDLDDPASWTRIHAEARKNAGLRKELMDRYLSAPEGEGRRSLAQLLAAVQTPDVLHFAMGLSSSTDAARRRQGLDVLSGMELKLPEVRHVVTNALKSERDPETLGSALAALRPAAVDPAEHKTVFDQLQGLTSHADAGVRARAVGALAGWDKAADSVGSIVKALGDPADQVRWATVTAVGENRIRSEEIKGALLALATNAGEQSDIRLAAVAALERFPLSKEESEQVVQIAMEADREVYPDSDQFNQSLPN